MRKSLLRPTIYPGSVWLALTALYTVLCTAYYFLAWLTGMPGAAYSGLMFVASLLAVIAVLLFRRALPALTDDAAQYVLFLIGWSLLAVIALTLAVGLILAFGFSNKVAADVAFLGTLPFLLGLAVMASNHAVLFWYRWSYAALYDR